MEIRHRPDGHRALDRRIAAIALPALATLAADPLYDLCDTAILGHLGTHQLAGAAIASRILGLGYAIFIFLLFGTTASVARLIGANRARDAVAEAIGAMWLGVALGVGAAVVVGLGGHGLIGAMGGHGSVAEHAWTYLSVSLLGFPAFMLVMGGTAYRRGQGDTRTPFVIAVATVAANLIIEVTLVYGFGFGVGASALGTVIAKWTGAIVYIALVSGAARRLGATVRPHLATIVRLLRVGGDLIVRTVALQLTIVVATALAARHGATQLAAYSIAMQIWMFCAYVSDGLEIAGHTLVAGELGRISAEGARLVARRIMAWSLRLGLLVGVIVLGFRDVVPAAFTDDVRVAHATALALIWVALLQPLNAVAFALDGILVGAGDQRFLAKAMVAAFAVFGCVALVIRGDGSGAGAIFVALGAFMAVRSVAGLARFAGDCWIRLGAV